MIKIFILVVITHVNSGNVVSFQEFNSVTQCNYTKDYIVKYSREVVAANCFEK